MTAAEGLPTRWNRLRVAAVGVVVLTFSLAALHGIANYWQWGHDGYNGAAFSQAARNSLRFGIVGQAQYHTGLDAPGVEAIYTHHPLALHGHLIVAQAALGSAEWVGRLTPVLYSIAGLILLYLLVARFADGYAALASTLVYTLTPLHLVFSSMVDHEQGAIFWLLAFFYSYLSWLEKPERRWLWATLACISIAAQFDWPAYYVAFFVAAHNFERLAKPWNRHARFLIVFSAVVLTNFAAFFAWIYLTRGTLSEMGSAYAGRASSPPSYLEAQLVRLLDLQGPLLLALLLGWLVSAARRRTRTGRATSLDLVVAAFLFAQLIHWVAFPAAAFNHSYWTYYLAPALSIGGGTAAVAAVRWALGRTRKHVAQLAVGAFVATLVLAQAIFAWHQFRWAEQNGFATYHDDYEDQFDEIMWVREVARIFPRPSALFVVDDSIRRRRIEFDYYLDGPILHDHRGRLPDQLVHDVASTRIAPRVRHHVLLLDLDHVKATPSFRSQLQRLSKERRALIWDRRFLAIDLADHAPKTEAFASRPGEASLLWRWLVTLDHPPVHWVRDAKAPSVETMLGKRSGS